MEVKGYGFRWLEKSAFLSIIRTTGEHISSRKNEGIVGEISWKTQLYNRYKQFLPKTKT